MEQRLNGVDAREQFDTCHANNYIGSLEWYVMNQCTNADVTSYIQNN